MKNNFIKSFLAIIGLCSFATASAHDFEVDGMFYSVISLDDMTCCIDNKDPNPENYKYQGDIVIPESVKYNNRMFSVTEIGDCAFLDCSSLTSVTIPNSVTSIGYRAFSGCSSLTSVTIPNSVTCISEDAFYRCSSLTSVTIPNSVTYIGKNAFYRCTSLTSVTIPNSVTKINNYTFYGCSSLTSVTIPNSVTYIGEHAFWDYSSQIQVKLEDGTTPLNYSNELYYSFDNVKYAYIGRNIKPVIYYDCFKSITSTLEIGPLVNSFKRAYYPDISLLISHNTTPPEINSFSNLQYMNLEVRVPAEAIDAYRQADVWRNFWNLQAIETSGLENIDNPVEFTVSINGNAIQVTGAADNQTMEVFGIDGKNIYSGTGRTVEGLSPGIYIVRIGGKSKKIAIK